jgi:hypothetical protein
LASGSLTKELARLVRSRDGRTSSEARRYALIVRGRWPSQENGDLQGSHGFYRNFTVVAETPEAALDLARVFVITEARPDLGIDECRDDGAAPTELLGVHDMSGYIFFPLGS